MSRLALCCACVLLLTVDSAGRGPQQPVGELPTHTARERVAGTIRIFGTGFAGMVEAWEEAFRQTHPDVRFDNHLPTSDAAFPALVTGVADLGPDGGEPIITETLSFFEVYGYQATQVAVATGGYDAEGRSNGLVVYVNRENPITHLTLQQLDGIFGAERTGGLHGFKWTLGEGRRSDRDIRTWGRLGLTGEWADKPIQTYGHAPSGTARFFQLRVLGNGDKWNPNFREYVETGSKMIGEDDVASQSGGLKHMLADELARDRYGVAFTVLPQARDIAGIKPIALAEKPGTPFVSPSRETFQDRSYPLARSVYIYLNRPPGRPLAPTPAEFLRFVLSREGQALVASKGYLPLPAALAREQLRKLE